MVDSLHQNEELMVLNDRDFLLEIFTSNGYIETPEISKRSASSPKHQSRVCWRTRSKRTFSIAAGSLKEVQQLHSPISRPLSMSK